MLAVNIAEAKAQLSKLIEAVERGEEVVIQRRGTPVVRLSPIEKPKRVFGIHDGKLGPVPDFLEPADEADLDAWENSF